MLGERSQAGQLYSLVCELIGTGLIVLWPILGLTHTGRGCRRGRRT
jgi:hypothetical protein